MVTPPNVIIPGADW